MNILLNNIDFNLYFFNKEKRVFLLYSFVQKNKIHLYFKVWKNSSFEIKKISFNNRLFYLFNKNLINNNNSLIVVDPNKILKPYFKNFYYSFLNQFKDSLRSINFGWTVKLNLIGLGYKVFFYKNSLYFRLGYCRMISISVPNNIFFIVRNKDFIRFMSNDKVLLGNFVSFIKKLRSFNLYKGKGIYELSDFSKIKLKVGKQQQLF